MREYIKNLTTSLISMHELDAYAKDWKYDKEGLPTSLYGVVMRSVSEMTPQTLGKILCSLEPSDVRHQLPAPFEFPYNFQKELPEVVGWCLASAIADRLDAGPDRNKTVPVYLAPPKKDPRLGE